MSVIAAVVNIYGISKMKNNVNVVDMNTMDNNSWDVPYV